MMNLNFYREKYIWTKRTVKSKELRDVQQDKKDGDTNKNRVDSPKKQKWGIHQITKYQGPNLDLGNDLEGYWR